LYPGNSSAISVQSWF